MLLNRLSGSSLSGQKQGPEDACMSNQRVLYAAAPGFTFLLVISQI